MANRHETNLLSEVDRRVGRAGSVRETLAARRIEQQRPLALIVVVVFSVTGTAFMLIACRLVLSAGSPKEGVDLLLLLLPVAAGYWGPAVGFVLGFYFQRSD